MALDCAGLVLHALDLPEADVRGYSRLPHHGLLEQAVDAAGLRRVRRAPAPGDVVLMRFMRLPQHLAIVTDCGIIHAWQGSGKVVEHRLCEKWSKRIVAVYE